MLYSGFFFFFSLSLRHPGWAECPSQLSSRPGSDRQHAGHTYRLASPSEPEVPPAAGDHVHDCGNHWPLSSGKSSECCLLHETPNKKNSGDNLSVCLFLKGQPSPQEAAAACRGDRHVPRFKVRGDVSARDHGLCLGDGSGLHYCPNPRDGNDNPACAKISTWSPSPAAVPQKGLKDSWSLLQKLYFFFPSLSLSLVVLNI